MWFLQPDSARLVGWVSIGNTPLVYYVRAPLQLTQWRGPRSGWILGQVQSPLQGTTQRCQIYAQMCTDPRTGAHLHQMFPGRVPCHCWGGGVSAGSEVCLCRGHSFVLGSLELASSVT